MFISDKSFLFQMYIDTGNRFEVVGWWQPFHNLIWKDLFITCFEETFSKPYILETIYYI